MPLFLILCSAVRPAEQGIYSWGYVPQGDLRLAVEDSRKLGFTAFRTAVSPYWDPTGNNSQVPIYKKILRDDYKIVFENFQTVLLTAYPLAIFSSSGEPYYRLPEDLLPQEKWNNILRESFLEFLQSALIAKIHYPNTTVIWSNWELENDCADDQIQRCMEFQKVRLEAIKYASLISNRFNLPGSGKIESMLEFTHVDTGWVPLWKPEWGNPPAPRKISGLDEALRPEIVGLWDYLCYSSWESLFYTEDPNFRPKTKLAENISKIQQKCKSAGRRSCPIIIGEIGFLWDQDPENKLLEEAYETLLSQENIKMIINWNLYDQPGLVVVTPDGVTYDQSKFGKFSPARELTPQGEFFRKILNR
jgi:hypothetical protein